MADPPLPPFDMPQHVVDQYAAAMRDSGMPPDLAKLVAQCIAQTMGQVADAFEFLTRLGLTLTGADAARMMRNFAAAWEKLRDTM